jgi:hypothetical protein
MAKSAFEDELVFVKYQDVENVEAYESEVMDLDLISKICSLKEHGYSIADGLFRGLFTSEEEDVLLALEVLGMVDTGVIRLLG